MTTITVVVSRNDTFFSLKYFNDLIPDIYKTYICCKFLLDTEIIHTINWDIVHYDRNINDDEFMAIRIMMCRQFKTTLTFDPDTIILVSMSGETIQDNASLIDLSHLKINETTRYLEL